jgi:hypothetical protein
VVADGQDVPGQVRLDVFGPVGVLEGVERLVATNADGDDGDENSDDDGDGSDDGGDDGR